MAYNIALASGRFTNWLTENNPFSRAGDAASQSEGKWIGRSLLVPVLAGVLCASIVDSVAVGGQGRAALTQMVKDPAAMFEGRSPGQRGAGALYNTKHKAVGTPSERTLANVPQDMGLPVVGDAADPVATALFAQPDAPPADSAVPEIPGTAPAWFTTPPLFSPIGGGIPGAPGNPGTDNPGTDNPDNPGGPGTPPPAVPEPATWLTLIVGLFSVGALLRYQRRAYARNLDAQATL